MNPEDIKIDETYVCPEAQRRNAEYAANRLREFRANRANDSKHQERPACQRCGKPLRRFRFRVSYPEKQWGDYGDGLFCNLTCGYIWAIRRLTQ